MTQIDIDAQQVHIEFPGWEALMTRRPLITIPLHAIREVHVEPGWTSEVLGMRAGLAISGCRKVGTFRHPSGTRRLVSMKRGLPVLRLGTDRAVTGFDELLLSTPDAARISATLHTGVRS